MTFHPRIGSNSCPGDNNPFFISTSVKNINGYTGYNTCTTDIEDAAGNNVRDKWLTVMPNCVGYACGRFNEIIGSMKYPSFNCNAENFINRGAAYYPELKVSKKPTLGGIMVWRSGTAQKADGNWSSSDGAGHVAIVEQINDDGSIIISDSNYGIPRNAANDNRFWRNKTLSKSDNYTPWSGYTFLGCICNPAVTNGDVGGPISDFHYSSNAGTYTDLYGRTMNLSSLTVPDTTQVTYRTEYKDVTTQITRSKINTADPSELDRTKSTSLLSYPNYVESPFVIVKIGDYTFGSCTKEGSFESTKARETVTYPNYMQGVRITKTNGTVNQYVINMVYQIQEGQDPNLLDKVFSSVGYGTIKISYGDWASPTFVYKEEEALITKISSNVDFGSSRISYTLYCTSNSIALLGTTFNFPARSAKPSDVIKEILYNNTYGLLEVFYGMKNSVQVSANNLIPGDDKIVELESKNSTDPLSYINYLVSCMTANTNTDDSPIKDSSYFLTIHDDAYNEKNLVGPYFKITKVNSKSKTLSEYDVYEVDIGYPGENLVTRFNISDDNSWSLIYKFAESVPKPQEYIYYIDDDGIMQTEYSPNLTTSNTTKYTTEAQKTWWTNMTQFPISATLEIKGLVRPVMLMTRIRVNALFYGQRHISSGLYIVTKQEDVIDGNGYRTVLNLTRIAGDTDYITKSTETVTTKVAYHFTV